MSREERLAEFVGWAQQHITRDEKGQAHIFLDRLFQAFGHPQARFWADAPMRTRCREAAGVGTRESAGRKGRDGFPIESEPTGLGQAAQGPKLPEPP